MSTTLVGSLSNPEVVHDKEESDEDQLFYSSGTHIIMFSPKNIHCSLINYYLDTMYLLLATTYWHEFCQA